MQTPQNQSEVIRLVLLGYTIGMGNKKWQYELRREINTSYSS